MTPPTNYDEYVAKLLSQLEKAKEERKVAVTELDAEKETVAAFQLEKTR